MPTKKRPYVPKTKGCHECSQRRIHCDRTEPQCHKCSQKGLKCSGLGIRHRFNNGVAARGKWVGMTMDRVYEAKVKKPKGNIVRAQQPLPGTKNAVIEEEAVATEPILTEIVAPSIVQPWEAISNIPDIEDLPFHDVETESQSTEIVLFQPMPDAISSGNRDLIMHFSQYIANEMIAFDGPHNGWRHLILPLAHTDDLVLNAVLAAADAHQRVNGFLPQGLQTDALHVWNPDSSQLYVRAICGLRERQELVHGDQRSRYSIITTIMVLLSAVMITGSSDFPVLFRMLESAIEAMGGKQGLGPGEYTDFILRQVNKMRVYAAPLMSEQTGVHVMSSRAQTARLLECLNHSVQLDPIQAVLSEQLSDLVEQARDIYLNQVFLDLDSSLSGSAASISSIRRVQRFKESMEVIPQDSPLQKVLVWASFVAASDCRLDEHKAFFEGVFQRRFASSGFGNLIKGLESLRKIWARNLDERWTSILPEEKLLVM